MTKVVACIAQARGVRSATAFSLVGSRHAGGKPAGQDCLTPRRQYLNDSDELLRYRSDRTLPAVTNWVGLQYLHFEFAAEFAVQSRRQVGEGSAVVVLHAGLV